MPLYQSTLNGTRYKFDNLRMLLAAASSEKSGDQLAGLAAESEIERAAARFALAEVSLRAFLDDFVVPYESDEITRLIADGICWSAFNPISHLTVGEFREWLLSDSTTGEKIRQVSAGITPEMAAAVSKIMRNQDLISVGSKCRIVSQFRSTVGLPGRLSTRLQPNHPTDDPKGIAASILDGLFLASGDAMIGINPASDNRTRVYELLRLVDHVRCSLEIPTQSCVLTHVTTTLELAERGAPVDLAFQSIAGTEAANRGFGIDLNLLAEAREATLSLKRNHASDAVMYFETGQGSALSSNSHFGVDQQTLEARAYAVAGKFSPFLVNSVVGFIGPEYLYNGKQIIRAALEDHFCAKLLGIPMGVDICYTNHAEADQDDMDNLLTLLGVAGVNFIMGVPGADDVMLNYQSTSFHDALYLREVLQLKPAPEFEAWLREMDLENDAGAMRNVENASAALQLIEKYVNV